MNETGAIDLLGLVILASAPRVAGLRRDWR